MASSRVTRPRIASTMPSASGLPVARIAASAASRSYAVRRWSGTPSTTASQNAPGAPSYGMPTLPALTHCVAPERWTNWRWTWPPTTTGASTPDRISASRSGAVRGVTISSSERGVPWQNSTPSASTTGANDASSSSCRGSRRPASSTSRSAFPRTQRMRSPMPASRSRNGPSIGPATTSPQDTTRSKPSSSTSVRTASSAGRLPWTSLTTAIRMRPGRPGRLLHRAREQPLDEVALEREEDTQRDRQRDERRRGDELDVRPELAQLGEDRDGVRLDVATERQGDDQVVPRPQELEDRQRGDGGQAERQDQPQEDPHLRGAVDPRGFEDVARYAGEEVAQQEDRERHPERHVEQDQAEHGVEQARVVVEREDRDQRHLDRHDEEADDDDEQHVAARELQPCERVAGHRGDDHQQQRVADRDDRRGDQRARDVVVVEQRPVVVQRRHARVLDDLPPALLRDAAGRHQRREQQAERRHEPQQRDRRHEDLERHARRQPADPGRPRLDGPRRRRHRLAAGQGCGCRLHHISSLRNRRTLSARAGMTSRNRNVAMAEPRPKSLTPPNEVRHIASAMTLASSCEEPGATDSTMSNTFRTLMSMVMKTTESTGASIGTVTRRNTCHSVAPSVRAASSTSRDIADSPAAITTIEKPAQTQM